MGDVLGVPMGGEVRVQTLAVSLGLRALAADSLVTAAHMSLGPPPQGHSEVCTCPTAAGVCVCEGSDVMHRTHHEAVGAGGREGRCAGHLGQRMSPGNQLALTWGSFPTLNGVRIWAGG